MSNRLAAETSPYLLQHANNPVDWQPWDETALALARTEDKPILLSIGYSACHWCHVMAHESFEDGNVAALMNPRFVCIKVDREERPDLDHIYQLAHQMLTGRPGGWPLTMFLTPDGTPFFGGTYFPKTARYGLPAFGELMQRISDAFRDQRREIVDQNRKLRAALGQSLPPANVDAGEFSAAALDAAVGGLAQAFDPDNGGFGKAPKFPRPQDLLLLLRRHAATGDAKARDMALTTLTRMAEGGIFDQLGGGFCRYSVDERWAIPHFEKMLYDNGPLLRLYAEAFALTGDPLYRRVAEDTAAWVLREMQSPEGGYYAALDADSEGAEGKFYVWAPDEALGLLTAEEYAVASLHYGLERPANFEDKACHLTMVRPLAEVASALDKPETECADLLAAARQKLFAAREQRVRPGRDEKILTSWNALMIEGLARAAAVFERPDWLASARRALDFIRNTLWQNGKLLATYKDGRANLNAYLDDHAFLLAALLELLQADFRNEDLQFAREVADALLTRFEDVSLSPSPSPGGRGEQTGAQGALTGPGGFYFTSHDHEALIHRPKPGFDNATPAGNGAAALALQRLGYVSGDSRYLDAARRTLQLFHVQMREDVGASATLLMALEEHLTPPQILVLRARPDDAKELNAWRRTLARAFRPTTLLLSLTGAADTLPTALAKPLPKKGESTVNAWLCRGVSCLAPVGNLEALGEMLKQAELL